MFSYPDTISRSESKSLGLKYYFNGNPCKNGNLSFRLVSSSRCICIDCKNENNKKRRDSYKNNAEHYRKYHRQSARKRRSENPEKFREYNREWYWKNRDRRIEYSKSLREKDIERHREKARKSQKKRYQEDPSKFRKRSKRWAEKNAERFREIRREWVKNNPEKAKELAHNRRSRMKNAEGSFSASDITRIFSSQEGRCAGCKSPIDGSNYHVDHIMPLALGGSNWPSNIQILCPPCNLSKGAKHPDEWAKEKLLST